MGGRWIAGWYVVPHQVIFRDLDAFGHVNNSVFFTYFEIARTYLWFELNGGQKPFDIGFIVARAECDFRQQLGMEPIDICVRIGEMRNTSLDFLYEIRKNGGQQVAAYGKVIVVLYDWKKQSKVEITEEFKQKVGRSQEA